MARSHNTGDVRAVNRTRLKDTRYGVDHQAVIAGKHSLVIRLSDYANGSPGECFIEMDKEGSTTGGLLNVIGILLSIMFQTEGVDIKPVLEKLRRMRFEPSGFVSDEEGNPIEIQSCSSIIDYIAHYLQRRYKLGEEATETFPEMPALQNPDGTGSR